MLCPTLVKYIRLKHSSVQNAFIDKLWRLQLICGRKLFTLAFFLHFEPCLCANNQSILWECQVCCILLKSIYLDENSKGLDYTKIIFNETNPQFESCIMHHNNFWFISFPLENTLFFIKPKCHILFAQHENSKHNVSFCCNKTH